MTAPRASARVHLAGAVSLLAWAGLAWASHGPAERRLAAVLGAHAAAWAALGWLARRPAGISFRALAGWAAAFWLCAFAARPMLDDDVWRFLWDGRMLVRTGNPFGSAPAEHFHDPALPPRFAEILDRVNHPELPTVYGPAAQLGFGLAYLAGPGRLWPWRLILAVAALGLALAVRRLAAGRPEEARSRAALLALWCPLLVFETGFNAHPDLLGVTWLTLAALAAGRGSGLAAGAAAALAAATKATALLLAPLVLSRAGRAAWACGAAMLAALYLPFFLQGGTAEFAGLRAMGAEWEFNSSVFGLVQALAGTAAARAVSAAGTLAVWVWMCRRALRGADASQTVPWMAAGWLLFSPVVNPWYALWLLPWVALRWTPAGLAALGAVTLAHVTRGNLGLDGGVHEHPAWVRPLQYGTIAAAALWSSVRRRA